MKKKGAVVIFKKGVSRQQIEEALKDLAESIQIEEYDPQWGAPVFYIP